MDVFFKKYTADHNEFFKKGLADQLFDGEKLHSTLSEGPISKSEPQQIVTPEDTTQEQMIIPETTQSTIPAVEYRSDSPVGHQQNISRQSTVYNRGPHLSSISTSPYHQKSTKLTKSEGLKEMFTPLGHTRRTTIFSVPETPTPKVTTRTYTASHLGAPQKGKQPADDDDGSSDSDLSPSPSLHRQVAKPSCNSEGKPSGGQGGGPPGDDGDNSDAGEEETDLVYPGGMDLKED